MVCFGLLYRVLVGPVCRAPQNGLLDDFNFQRANGDGGGGGSSWLAAQPCGSSQPLSSMIFLYLVAEGRILDRGMSTEWVRVRNCGGPIQSDCPECAIYLLVLWQPNEGYRFGCDFFSVITFIISSATRAPRIKANRDKFNVTLLFYVAFEFWLGFNRTSVATI